MKENGPVPFSELYKVFKTKYPFSGIGLIFITLSLLVFLPLIAYLNWTKEPYEKYNYEKIINQGKDLKATIISVQAQNNITINNNFHPLIIEYSYLVDGHANYDKFKTLTNTEKNNYKSGDTLSIKVYNGKTVIKNLNPFSFPINLFYILPLIFLIIGIPFFLIGLLPTLKNYSLYKNGIRKEATIISLMPTKIFPFVTMQQNILVNYFYIDQSGKKILAHTIYSGLNLMIEKKAQDKIDIFVSPKNEQISCVVPAAFF